MARDGSEEEASGNFLTRIYSLSRKQLVFLGGGRKLSDFCPRVRLATVKLPKGKKENEGSMDTYTGQRFGNYRLTRFLGDGTFGEVYYAEHVHQKTPAAVKVFKTKLTPDKFKTFINEVRSVLLKHPNIVPVIDFGIREEDGIAYLVMKYAPKTLRQHHPKGTRLSLEQVILYIKQVAASLQHAHDERFIHRDVKPENILLGPNSEVWLSDFGIAAIAHGEESLVMQNIAGTVVYMAPEQLQGKPCPASDQYALGIMAYEWLCGEYPFHGTPSEIAMQHLHEPPPSLCGKVPTLSPAIEQVVLRALAKEPQSRFGHVFDFAQKLEQVYRSEHTESASVASSPIVRALSWSPDGRYIALASEDGAIQVRDSIDEKQLHFYYGHADKVLALSWSPDNRSIVSGSEDRTVRIWDAITGELLRSHNNKNSVALAVAWSPDRARIASGSYNATVQIWDVNAGTHLITYSGHSKKVHAVAWSPDGKRIASGSEDGTVQVWDVDTSTLYRTYRHSKAVRAIAWSPDGLYIASGSIDETVQVNSLDGTSLRPYYGHSAGVLTLAWSPNGLYIASGSDDKTVQVWDPATRMRIKVFRHAKKVLALSWSPDSKRIASSSEDRTVRTWQVM